MSNKLSIDWGQVIRPAIVSMIFFTIVTGLLYPGLITAIAQVIFPDKADGSLIKDDADNIIGSELIGQEFSNPISGDDLQPLATTAVPPLAQTMGH